MSVYDLSYLNVRCRPIDTWPGILAPSGTRERSQFHSSLSKTIGELAVELRAVSARNIILQLAIDESEIVVDGSRPKGTARPRHPGVVLVFESVHGPLKIATDKFSAWEDNLRAIALGLHDLRRLDRYGITKRGEQYRGWQALPAPGNGTMGVDEASMFVASSIGFPRSDIAENIRNSATVFRDFYLVACKQLHPDVGGTEESFKRLQAAKAVLDRHHGVTP